MSTMKTQRLTKVNIDIAVDLLSNEKIVAIPTETVYGLAGDAFSDTAIQSIYRAKGRVETKPLSVLVSDMKMVESLCDDIPKVAYKLVEKFWPGPLTLVLKHKGLLSQYVTANGATLGVRCPQHDVTLEIIKRLGHPLGAPSANVSNMSSPKNVNDVLVTLDEKIDAVIDGGECMLSIESTILDLSQNEPIILRQGALNKEEIWTVLQQEGYL